MKSDDHLGGLAKVMEPMRSALSQHHHRLVGAGLPAEVVSEASIGWSARALADAAGPGHAAQRLRDLAETLETGAALAGDVTADEGAFSADSAPQRPAVE